MRKIFSVILAGIIASIILSLFSVFYKYSTLHVAISNGPTDYKWKSNGVMNNMEEGFAFLRMDENGYNNIHEKTQNADNINILLMGSSNMQAIEVDGKENCGYLLNDMIDEYSTYNIGISGHFIYTCVSNLEFAINEYRPNKAVVIETNDVCLNEKDMLKVINDSYPEISLYTSRANDIFSTISPGGKRLLQKILVWKNADAKQSEDNVDVNIDDIMISSEYFDTLNTFLAFASARAEGVDLIIFYNPRTLLAKDGSILDNNDEQYVELFAQACEENNIIFIDMTEDYRKLYENEKKLAHGFINTGVGVGHLNKYGHKVIAEHLARVLMEE